MQRVSYQVVGVLPAEFGAAHRWHRGDQRPNATTSGPCTAGRQHASGPVSSRTKVRQHPAPLDELTGESRQFGQVAERGAVADRPHRSSDRGQRERTGGIELDRRNRPRQQRRLGSRGRARGDPNQLRGIQRRLASDGNRNTAVPGLPGTSTGEHVHRRGERVRTRRTQRLAGTGDGRSESSAHSANLARVTRSRAAPAFSSLFSCCAVPG